MFRFYKTMLNLKTRLQEQNQKKIFIFFHYHLNHLFICSKTKLEIKYIFYRMNSFATFEQPYFCCKTKLKIKLIFYRMSLFYIQNEFFYKQKFFFTELNFLKRDTNIYFK